MEAWWLVLIKSVVLVALLFLVFAYLMLFERKFLGFFQLRVGPNRTGPWGLFQPFADAVKLVLKEDIIPASADPLVYRLAPMISLFVALAAYVVIPVAPSSGPVRWGIADPNAGILLLLAITSLGVYGITLGGWASQGKYTLLGSLRSTAQAISYELAMGMSLVGVLLLAGSVRLDDIVAAQARIPFAVLQPLGFLIFLICIVAETNRSPFDLPEGETELVGGYHTEYTGLRFAMYYMAEYINMIVMASLLTHLYLGGWQGPLLPPVVWFALKVAVILFVFIWLRATLPRIRYDRLMNFGWKVLLPLAALNLLGTAAVVALA
ncbi:NADH-quinone oxidoreductase subunit NuoH [Limnochorda pilosa]|uniref:NADH-quinone oxidoreductase subunit H n=1 Tax=Limnochorda pilosa TaxID=1555112 RepID=A0A0K2SP91_LIMPI|nr:NADH-quinone oxidoreductase subunit NuoH [Limnochorda pilosa]BAS28940.1 NADH:ubiquinone oxidoreductase subunit H [Limnochorda pilosa]